MTKDFDENKHQRDSDGEFSIVDYMGNPNKGSKVKTAQEFIGAENKGVKGYHAIEKLLHEKSGYVSNAFERPEIGGIDIIWGDDSGGLQHIIKRREKQGVDGISMIRRIPEIIDKGDFKEDEERGNFNIEYGEEKLIISPKLRDKKVTWVVTSFKTV